MQFTPLPPLATAPTDRAVSPVIGVILMVAITVILAAVVGTFVLGLTPDTETGPTATVQVEGYAGPGNVTLVHAGGEAIQLDDFVLLTDGTDAPAESLPTATLSPGQRILIEGLEDEGSVEVVLRHEPSGQILTQTTVRIE